MAGVGNGRTPKTGAARIAREMRTARILEGRVAGKRLVTIAAEEGISTSRVAQIVEAELDTRKAAAISAMRRLEAERLDALQAAVWPAALRGGVGAIEAALGIMARRARLMGLDAPARMMMDEGPDPSAARASLEEKLMSLSRNSPAGPIIEGIAEDVTPELIYQIGAPPPPKVESEVYDLPEPEIPDELGDEDLYGEAGIFSR